jgi:hypothetical protein
MSECLSNSPPQVDLDICGAEGAPPGIKDQQSHINHCVQPNHSALPYQKMQVRAPLVAHAP